MIFQQMVTRILCNPNLNPNFTKSNFKLTNKNKYRIKKKNSLNNAKFRTELEFIFLSPFCKFKGLNKTLFRFHIIKLQKSVFQFSSSLQSVSFFLQNTTRNCGASEPLAGKISHRHGSRSSETGQYPASVTLSDEAATDPNSKTVTSGVACGLGTSTAPFMPGISGGEPGFGSGFLVSEVGFWEGFHQDRSPMADDDGDECSNLEWCRVFGFDCFLAEQ